MTVRFAHISDTHIGPSRDFVLYGVPNHEGVEFDPSPLAYYHLITLTDQQMLVRQMDVGI